MFREKEPGFWKTEKEKLEQIKAEAEVEIGSLGSEKAMERAAEKRKEKKVIFDAATELAKAKAGNT